jgi:hypothetical protein
MDFIFARIASSAGGFEQAPAKRRSIASTAETAALVILTIITSPRLLAYIDTMFKRSNLLLLL